MITKEEGMLFFSFWELYSACLLRTVSVNECLINFSINKQGLSDEFDTQAFGKCSNVKYWDKGGFNLYCVN